MRRLPPYNESMRESVLDELKCHIGFDTEDGANVAEFAKDAEPLFTRVRGRFYEEMMQHPRVREMFVGDEDQIDRRRRRFANWLSHLFSGDYEAGHFEWRSQAGWSPPGAGVPQHEMIGGMEVVWQEFERSARAANVPDVDAKLRSFHKLLTLELAVMLDS